MAYYFSNYIDKIKATKKLAREKNVPVWHIPLANSIGILILTAVYMSVYTWIAIVDTKKKQIKVLFQKFKLTNVEKISFSLKNQKFFFKMQ